MQQHENASKLIRVHSETQIILEVQHHKGVYVSVEEPTKGRVAVNPKSSLNNIKGRVWLFTISPHEDEGNTNFLELNHNLGSLRAMPSHLGD
jgi:phage tail sheath gpL-like